MHENQNLKKQDAPQASPWRSTILILSLIFLVLVALGGYWIWTNFYAAPIQPVELTQGEEKVLEEKLEKVQEASAAIAGNESGLEPEPYSEQGAKRDLAFSERELNALIARSPELADRVSVDLSPGMLSVTALVPVDKDFPVAGGTTVKLKLGVELGYHEGAPTVVLKGVSLGGVPIPSAWLGGLKHKNLVKEFGNERGFWKLFSDGVKALEVEDGQLKLSLKE